MNRRAKQTRTTRETSVDVAVDIDGSGAADVTTGIGFFDHLLQALAHHGMLDLTITASGDIEVDDHHTVEDTAMVLGAALAEALGERAGISRFGSATVPMDEAIATAAVDAGGRPYAVVTVDLQTERIGQLSTQMIPHAIETLARTAGFTVHVTASGSNDHHVAEAAFKALARALRTACELDARRTGIASTKGEPVSTPGDPADA